VCSNLCRNKLRAWRAELDRGKRCPMCYRPCTEGEKASWRAWRASEGPLQSAMTGYKGNGNLHAAANQLRKALAESLEALRERWDNFATTEGVKYIDGLVVGSDSPAEAVEILQDWMDQIQRLTAVLESSATRPKKKKIDDDPAV
jgi:hypothetical protein